jgi:hypothetical protein
MNIKIHQMQTFGSTCNVRVVVHQLQRMHFFVEPRRKLLHERLDLVAGEAALNFFLLHLPVEQHVALAVVFALLDCGGGCCPGNFRSEGFAEAVLVDLREHVQPAVVKILAAAQNIQDFPHAVLGGREDEEEGLGRIF